MVYHSMVNHSMVHHSMVYHSMVHHSMVRCKANFDNTNRLHATHKCDRQDEQTDRQTLYTHYTMANKILISENI